MKKTLTHDSKRQGHSLGLTQQAQTCYSCLLHLSALRFLPSFVLPFLLALLPSLSYAYTYSTVANGNWSSPKTWRDGIMPKSYIKADDVVYIRHNVVYNLPKDLTIKGKVNLERGVVCKNSAGKILSSSFFVKKNYATSNHTDALQKTAAFAVGDPCNAVRWNDGGAWTGGCLVNDANNADGGVVRCGNAADTQSGVPDNTTYNPAAFTITPSSGCMDPDDLSPVTVTAPFSGQKIAWYNFDVRPYAGTYDFQTIATGNYELNWALYYSTAPTCSVGGNGLSGNCAQLSGVIACGIDFNGWAPQPFITPVFDQPTNLYLVVWKRGATTSANDDFDFTFKARYGCGDFCSVFLNGSPTVTCNPDGSYKVVQSLNGSSTTVSVTAPGSTSIVTNPSPLTFTTADAVPNVNTGTVTVTYPAGVNYNITFTPSGTGTYCTPKNISGTAPVCPVCTTPTVTTTNACIGGGNVTFTQSGGTAGGTWSISGGGTIVPGTGVFTPTTAGCYTATYTTPTGGCTDTKSFVVFPGAPTITAPSNTCNTAFSLPTITAVSGFTVQYSLDGAAFANSPTIPTTPGCHTITARYVLTSTCGTTAAGTAGTGVCGSSNTVSVVIFPTAPTITAPANTCASPFVLPSVPAVAGFNSQYSVDGGVYAASPTIPTTPGCHTITARYVLAADCGATLAGTAGSGLCGPSNTVSVVIFPALGDITVANTCNAQLIIPAITTAFGFRSEYSFDGGATWSTLNGSVFTTPGCYNVQARYVLIAACGNTAADAVSNGVACDPVSTNAVIFPAAPTITAPANTCASAFSLPSVTAVSGFTVEYSIDGAAFETSPTVPTTPGCHTIAARYVLTSTCGTTAAGTAGTGACGNSNTVSVVIFPNAPTITAPANTCASAFSLPSVAAVSGFTVEYSIDGGAFGTSPTIPSTPGCHTITARYVLTSTCGLTAAGTPGAGACGNSNTVSVVIFPTAPVLDPLTNTCAANFSLPTVSAVAGFTVQYSIDGGAFTDAPMVNMVPGCHMITARYVLTSTCGLTAAGTAGTGACGNSNTIQVVVFPSAPVITPPANTCASAFVLPNVAAVANFNIEYSIDGGAFVASPTIPTTPGCHTIAARYVLAADCVPPTPAGTAGTGDCGNSNTVSVVIFPNAPVITPPANTCASAFSLPSVSTVAGFNIQYSIDGGAYAASPTIPTTPGCHTITARYVLAADCGATLAGTAGSGLCGPSNTVSVVIFPALSGITVANTCDAQLIIPAITTVAGFRSEYSFDGGASWSTLNGSVFTTPGCYNVQARYVLIAACGNTAADAVSDGAACDPVSTNAVIFPPAPTITAPANTCASAFSLPTVSAVAGFSLEYSIDGGAFAASPAIPTTPGCHTITARYVLTSTCGLTAAGTPGTGACGNSNTVSVVIFPNAPVIDAPANTCASAFSLPSVAAVSEFSVEYSIDGGAFGTSPTVPTTPGCHTIAARYVLTSTCGLTAAGTPGTGACGNSNTVNVVIFPSAPTITAPANTCASAFSLPSVTAVSEFSVEYSIDGGAFAASPTVPTTPGCHTLTARYVLTSTCGTTAAGTAGTGACGNSNTVNVVIFPTAPVLDPLTNTCDADFSLPTVSAVAGFTVQYSIDGGAYTPAPMVNMEPGCHMISARYVLTADCGAALAGTAGTSACGVSNTVQVVVFPDAPTLTAPSNTCASAFTLPTVATVAGFNIQYSVDGGAYAASPTIPTTPGCHTIVARYVLAADCGPTLEGTAGTGDCGTSNTVSVVIFPNAPTIDPPANTCASAFSLPSVAAVAGFTVQYSIDGGAFGTSPTIPTTPGCHTITARYVLTSTCGTTAAGTPGTGACGNSNTVNVVIFPNAPEITPTANTCASAFSLPSVAAVSGFTVEYSIDGGAFGTSPTIPTTPGCHTITARYVLTSTCGVTTAGTPGTGDCGNSNTVSVVIFPNAPTIDAPANTCASAFSLPSVAAVAGFTVQYSIDGGAFGTSPTIPTTPGCHTITARYVLTSTCGLTAAGTPGTGDCGNSNTVSVVIFPNAPSIDAPTNTCASAFSLPSVAAVAGFTVQYSIDGGAFGTSPTIPTTPGCHTIMARYVLTSTCGLTAAGTPGTGACGNSNTVNVVIFPSAPEITPTANTCASAFSLPSVAAVAGFTVEYSIDGGAFGTSPTIPTTPGCHTITARYVLTSTCGLTPAGTPGTGDCGNSNTVSVVIFPNAPTIDPPANTCASAFSLPSVAEVSGFTVEYSIDGGAFGTSPAVPSTPGCHTIAARYVLTSTCGATAAGAAGTGACSNSNTVNVVVFPNAPTITAPANTCASAFSLPSVAVVAGFTVEYSIDGGAFGTSPTVPTTPGCHTIAARYVLTSTCGATAAGTAGTGACGNSNTVNVVIFPNAPTVTPPANTCASAFVLPSVAAVAGFTVQYSIDGEAFGTSPTIPTTPGCHTITARYVLTSTCGLTVAGTPGAGACGNSNTVSVVIFPTAPKLTAPANTCASFFVWPTAPEVAGFTVEYSLDGGAYVSLVEDIPSTPGCYTITARYVLTSTCGTTAAGTPGTGDCGSSNPVSVVIFPKAPTITAPANTCDQAFTLPNVAAVAGFTVQYSLDGGAYSAAPTVPTSVGCHSIKARYVLTNTCGGTAAGTAGEGQCGESNEVKVIIFPKAPIITATSNTCAVAFALPEVPVVSGFTVQYRIDDGAYSANPTIPTTPGCHRIQARYVITAACGLNVAGTAGSGDCGESNTVYVVIYPAAPSLTAPANTCNAKFILPSVSSVEGFDVEFSIDGGAYSGTPNIPTTPGCHTIRARYVLENGCGSADEGSTGNCPASNEVSVVIFPATPALSISNTCGTTLSFSNVPTVAGFNTVYDVTKPGGTLVADNVDYATAIAALDNTIGTWTITVGYALSSACGSTPAGTESSAGGCGRLILTPRVYEPVTTNAGPDQATSACVNNGKVTLAGSITGGITTGIWVGGTGTFMPNRNTLNAMYTPSEAEIKEGFVILSLQSDDPEGPCPANSDQVKILIDDKGVSCHGDQINVSLNINCEFLVTPQIVLVNPTSQPEIYQLWVADERGVAIPGNLLTGIHAGLVLKYYIRNTVCGDECWGYIKVEDKQAPKIANANFSKKPVYCFDANFVLNNPKTVGTPGIKPSPVQIPAGTIATGTANDEVLNLGIATFTNCDPTCKITVKWSDRLETYPCDSINKNGTWGRIYRTWVATNCVGMRKDTVQVIVLKRPLLSDFAFTGDGKKDPATPNYDWTVTYNACSPDKSLIKKVDWMPRINSTFHMLPDLDRRFFLDQVECNYSVQIKDTEFSICGGKGVKIDRELYVFDWCKGGIVDTFHILIKIGDFEAPKLEYAHHAPFDLSTGPMDCTAALPTSVAGLKSTFGVNITDNCGVANVSVTVKTKDRYIKGILIAENVWDKVEYAVMNGNIVGLPAGRHRLIIDAFDGCYNTKRDSFEFNVLDKIAPVMKCDDDLHVTLSNANGYTSGYAQVSAADIDENSTDNCKLAWIAVRRNVPDACVASFIAKGYDTNGNGKLDAASASGDVTNADGFDINGDGDIADFGEAFIIKGGKLMTPLQDIVEFFCCDLTERVTVELWGGDASGNTNYCWMDLAIEDKVAPVCAAPWDVVIDCDDKNLGLIDSKTASARFFGDVTIVSGNDCAPLDTVYTVEKKLKCGAGYIIRKWTLTKQTAKGPITIECSQKITVRAIHEYNICFPKDASSDCKTPIVDTVLTDELGCDILAVNVFDKRYDASDDECYKIFRTYTVINWCAYDDRCGDPMTEGKVYVVNRATFGNYGKAPIYVLVRDENRNEVEEFYLSKDLTPKNADDERFFPAKCTATDEFYHSFMYTQIIKVYDSERPVVTATRDTFCTSPTACTANITKVVTLKDNCTNLVELERQQLMIAPFQTLDAGKMILYSTPRWSVKDLGNGKFEISVSNVPEGLHDLVVVGRDECGNLSVATRLPFVVKDCKAPAPICINGLSTDLMPDGNNGGMMTVWATDFVASKIYDCNGQGPETKDGLKLVTKYSINRVGSPVVATQTSLNLTCADKGKLVMVELHAWDEAGNHDFCVTFIEVQDNRKVCPGVVDAAEISGVITTDDLEPLNGVNLDLSGTMQMNQSTSTNGAYLFNNLTKGGDYTVTAQLDKNHANGVSTFDIVLIQKHILGIEAISNPYRQIAADVNNSKSITTLDIIQIRKLILGIDAKFANVPSWKFVDASYTFPQTDNPLSTAFPEVVNVNDLIGKVKADFIGVKMGDVNGNASASGAVAAEIRGAKDMILTTEEQELKVGQIYNVSIRAKDLNQLQGFQFTLQVAAAAEIVGLDYGVMKAENFGLFQNEGILTSSFVRAPLAGALGQGHLQGMPQQGDEILFTLKLKANAAANLSNILDINSRRTNVEAYSLQNEVMGVQLSFGSKAVEDRAALYQNTPNPFIDETQIGFYLPSATRAVLTVRDVKGALIYKVEGNYTKGNNQVVLKKEQLRASGVMYYTLETSEFTATKKLVLLNR